MNNKGNRAFPKNILHFIERCIANIDIFDEVRVRHVLKDKPSQSYLIREILVRLELLNERTKGNVDILLISETKINESFPDCQFKIDGLSNAPE